MFVKESISLGIREIKIITKLRYQDTHRRSSSNKKTNDSRCHQWPSEMWNNGNTHVL